MPHHRRGRGDHRLGRLVQNIWVVGRALVDRFSVNVRKILFCKCWIKNNLAFANISQYCVSVTNSLQNIFDRDAECSGNFIGASSSKLFCPVCHSRSWQTSPAAVSKRRCKHFITTNRFPSFSKMILAVCYAGKNNIAVVVYVDRTAARKSSICQRNLRHTRMIAVKCLV